MKNRLPTVTAITLIALSALLGMVVASALKNGPADSNSPPVEVGLGDSQEHFGDSMFGQFVQEPPTRSALRPDFSNGVRYPHQRNNFFMLRAFNDAVGDSWKSTVKLLNEAGQQVALGAIVGSDGWIVTKASELPAAESITCKLYDNSVFEVERFKSVDDLDIALVRIAKGGLPVVSWAATSFPERGRWLATIDSNASIPSAVGVVSAGPQSVVRSRAVLGVSLSDSDTGALVNSVLPGSGADIAGLVRNDQIIEVNGQMVSSRDEFMRKISNISGGQSVQLVLKRGENEVKISARLMDLADELWDETEMEVNGPISARSTGFSRVFTHDTVLSPNQCGGPVVNLDGNVVGLNIARAGRVSTYALPADIVKPLVDSLMNEAQLVSRPMESNAAQPIR